MPSTGLNHHEYDQFADPETQARIAQYEMAFRMQTSVPELADISSEPKHILDMYGPDVHKPGTFARCCLLARRLAERDVRFVQIFHRGWDQHGNLPGDLPRQCQDVDQASFALVTDLKQRGLLDDTLVIWGGEFGRTVYCQGKLTRDNYGRDHHPKCFPIWMAGAGIKPGIVLRRDRRLQLQRRRRPGAHPRSERHDPSLPGHRPPPLERQVPGAGRAPDRCRAASSGQGDFGVTPRYGTALCSAAKRRYHRGWGVNPSAMALV